MLGWRKRERFAAAALLCYISSVTAALSARHASPTRQRPKTASERRARVAKILEGWDEMYPEAACDLKYKDAWQLLAATILSAQSTDKRVSEVTPGLFATYPAIPADCRGGEEESVRFRRKDSADDRGDGDSAGRGKQDGQCGARAGVRDCDRRVVDTHVQRISRRLDFTKQSDPVKIEQNLTKIIPQDRGSCFPIK